MIFGGLPTPPGGIPAGVVGCNESLGDGVGTAFIALTSACAHELGHALGRDHSDTDSNYPNYDSFQNSSIGVFGFDPTTNTVINPATAQDFMKASIPGTPWVSPYTYQALLAGPQGAPGPGGAQMSRHVRTNMLFLRLSVDRKRKVTRLPSFYYEAPLQYRGGCQSDFTVEFLDEDRNVLDCAPLHCRCTDQGCRCWPKVLHDGIPYPDGTKWLLVWQDDEKRYEEEIPDPPKVKIAGTEPHKEDVILKWSSNAKGRACREVSLDDYQPQVPGIGIVGVDPNEPYPKPIPCVITATATDTAGRQLDENYLTWYRDGASIARGNQLDLRTLKKGRHVVRAVLRGIGDRLVARSWVVDRTPAGCVLISTVCDPPTKGTSEDHPHPHPHPEPPPCD
jgi:hypothetical protein